MVDGRYNDIGFIIQARLGSTRLPNKVLKPLPFDGEKPVLKVIIDEVLRISKIPNIIVATSKSTINDKLEDFCKSIGVEAYRGDEENVLSRFNTIIKNKSFKHVVRLTGDNPFIDSSLLKESLDYHIKHGFEYTKTEGLPLGCNFEIIKSSSITEAHDLTKSNYDREHVTPYIRQSSDNQGVFKFSEFLKYKDLRLTIDYPSDYAFSYLLLTLYSENKIQLKEIVTVIEANKWLTRINANNYQKIKAETLAEEIELISPILKEMELHRLKDFLDNESE